MTDFEEEIEVREFAARAAKFFAADKKMFSFTDEKIKPGCLLALRWGLGDDCVLVLKLDCMFEPVNFQQAVRKFEK